MDQYLFACNFPRRKSQPSRLFLSLYVFVAVPSWSTPTLFGSRKYTKASRRFISCRSCVWEVNSLTVSTNNPITTTRKQNVPVWSSKCFRLSGIFTRAVSFTGKIIILLLSPSFDALQINAMRLSPTVPLLSTCSLWWFDLFPNNYFLSAI